VPPAAASKPSSASSDQRFIAKAGMQLDPTFVKVVAWYDNEYGYTCNLMRLVRHVAK
jgi:glyceraldehyde-3-phosphate dehydrogenase/erythrose-4-phosphate dehydrogenase